MSQLTVVIRNQSGLYAKVSVALIRGKLKLRNTISKTLADGNKQYTFSVDDPDGKLEATCGKIEQLDGVMTVEVVGVPSPQIAPPTVVSNSDTAKVVQQLHFARGNIVGIVKDFTMAQTPANTQAMVYELGRDYGAGITALHGSPMPRSIEGIIKQIILPAIAPFSMADRHGLKVAIALCPFCRDSPQHLEHCSFLHGFITGAVNETFSGAVVTEQSSQANGASECLFNVQS